MADTEAGDRDSESHYVQEAYRGSLVHYPPSERRINPIEKKLMEDRSRLTRVLGLADIFNPEVWRAALVELVASTVVDFMSYVAVVVILSTWDPTTSNPKLAISLIHLPIVGLVILAAAPASGGHLNPCITMTTMFTGHTTPVRALLYVTAQSVGAVCAASIVHNLMPHYSDQHLLGGCSLNIGGIPGEGIEFHRALLSEFVFTFILLLLAYFIALDPRQLMVTGLVLAPFLVGGIISILLFLSGSLHSNYTGAGMHPARCLGPAMVLGYKQQLQPNIWNVFWLGPFLASFAMALVYHAVPPHHVDKYARRKDTFHQIYDLVRRREPASDVTKPWTQTPWGPGSTRVSPAPHKDDYVDTEKGRPKTHHDHVAKDLRFHIAS